MGQNPVVIDAMHTALNQTGAGSGGTRNIGGTSHYHVALERELASLHSKGSALLYSSAYVANEWSLVALKQIIPDIVFLSDSENHASLIQGIRHSGADKMIVFLYWPADLNTFCVEPSVESLDKLMCEKELVATSFRAENNFEINITVAEIIEPNNWFEVFCRAFD